MLSIIQIDKSNAPPSERQNMRTRQVLKCSFLKTSIVYNHKERPSPRLSCRSPSKPQKQNDRKTDEDTINSCARSYFVV